MEYTSEDYSHIQNTNLESAYNLTQVTIPLLQNEICKDHCAPSRHMKGFCVARIPDKDVVPGCCCQQTLFPRLQGCRGCHVPMSCPGVQLAHPLLKAAGKSSVVMISSVAGGPSTVQSGTIYAMLKGVVLTPQALYVTHMQQHFTLRCLDDVSACRDHANARLACMTPLVPDGD